MTDSTDEGDPVLDDVSSTGEGAVVVDLAERRKLFPRAEDADHDPKRERSKCKHRRVWVDKEERVLTCQDCGKPADPITFILRLAREWSYVQVELKLAEQDADRARERAAESAKTAERARRARDARAMIRQVDVDHARAAKQDPKELGEWIIEALTMHPIVIIETKDGKLLRRHDG